MDWRAPKRLGPRRTAGLTLLEFTLIVIIVGLLMVFFLQRAVALRVAIEQAAVERTVAAMRTGLALRRSELIVKDRRAEIADLPGSNALDLLDPEQILDRELRDTAAGADAIGPGDWGYDADTGEIVYRVEYNAAFDEHTPEGRWRIAPDGETVAPGAVRLETTKPIDWP